MADVSAAGVKPKSLKGRMSCGMSDCTNGLHCFQKTRKKLAPLFEPLLRGACQVCGEQGLVEWSRVQRRDINDIEYTIEVLKKECVRHCYWCLVEISEGAINHARRKGRCKMRAYAEKVIRRKVGDTHNAFAGRQTPWEGDDPIPYAQHATASCCRKCIERWHGIKQGRDLTEDEIQYLTSLVMRYIEEKIQLTEAGEKVPYRRKKRTVTPQSESEEG